MLSITEVSKLSNSNVPLLEVGYLYLQTLEHDLNED